MRILHLANRHHDEPSAGHGYWLNHAYEQSCVENGVEFLLIAPANSKDPYAYPLLRLDRKTRSRLTFFPLIGLSDDCRSLHELIASYDDETILHIYEGGLRELLLVIRLKAKFKSLKVVFNFNLSDPWHTAVSSRNALTDWLWHLLTRAAAPLLDSVAFTAETKELADLMMQKLGIPIAEYQLPSLVPIPFGRKEEKKWDLFIPVFGTREFELVAEALEILSRNRCSMYRILIQPKWEQPLSDGMISRIEKLGAVVLPKVLSQREYVDFVSLTKVVVLPYKDLDYYRLQSSGRMVDAVALGADVLVPQFTSLARQVRQAGWGSSFDVESSSNLADALLGSLQHSGPKTQSRAKVPTPYKSIMSQVANLSGDRGHGSPVGPEFTSTRFTVAKLSLILLFSDLRTLASGVLGALGISMASQFQIAKLLPRK